MLQIAGFSVKKPVTVTVLYALAIGMAITLVPNIAVDLFPSTARPVLTIFTSFPGASAEDVERNVTDTLEKALASSKHLTSIKSSSSFEFSNIDLEFSYGTDMDQAMLDAQTVVNRIANSLPDGAETPRVNRFDMAAMPIMQLVVRGNYPPDQLRLFAEDEIQPEIERIDGVAAATVTGGATRIVKVEVSLNRLAAFGLTLTDISNALRGQSVLSSGGTITRSTREYQIMTSQELTSPAQLRRIVVKNTAGGAAVRLEDIADVGLGYDETTTRVHVNGQSGVYVQVTAESDANQVQVARRIKTALNGINSGLPQGITLSVLSDNTSLIEATLGQVYANAFQGGVLAMIILFVFLRNIKGTLIIGFSIPISILLTLMFMAVFGFTLNLLTMTGLIMGLGMTVDASIVILENVHNYRERGAKPQIAAILGGQEMMRAIIASTATTVCVFIPLIIYKNDLESMGQLFNDLIFTVVISLCCSLAVAVTLVPALCGSILRLNTRKQKPLKNPVLKKIDDSMEAFFRTLDNGYRTALEYCLSHRLIIIALTLALFVFSAIQFRGTGMNMFIRARTDDTVRINVTLPPGSTLDTTERALRELETQVKEQIKGYTNIVLTARRSSAMGRGGSGQGTLQITLPPPARQIDTPATIQEKLTAFTSSLPGIRFAFSAGRNMGTSSAVDIAVTSRDNDALMQTAGDILAIIERFLPEVENPAVNLTEGPPQLNVTIDRDRAAALGVSLSAIAGEIKTAMNGSTAATLSSGLRLTDVVLQLRAEDRQGLPNLDAVFVVGKNGARVPLSNVASINEGRALSSIRREDRQRIVRVTGSLPSRIAVTEFQKQLIETVNSNLIAREGVTVRFLGEAADVQAYNWRFLLIIGTAIFLVFGVMASQFESFVDPLIIFFTIPLLAIGVIWIYKIGNQPMSMFSMVGVVALVGVVVNNGIVLVDYTNTLRARGLNVREACIEAGRSRLRPILMTSLTTILGMAPVAFVPGAGADTIQPIGKTFVGGLTASTLMTLFVVPVMYSVLNARHDKKKKQRFSGTA
jgi:HAE1 family hydrophobic/amphiphilic exporter-1